MTFSLRVFIPLVFIGFLSGCQSPPTATPVSVNQLAAVVAASNWTRINCARSDIPDETRLLRAALKVADVKSEGNHNISQQELLNEINQRFAALNNDGQNKAEKCSALNSALAPFLQQIKSQNK